MRFEENRFPKVMAMFETRINPKPRYYFLFGIPHCWKCGKRLIRFQWVGGYKINGVTYWYFVCPYCWEFPTMFLPAGLHTSFIYKNILLAEEKTRQAALQEAARVADRYPGQVAADIAAQIKQLAEG